MISQSEIYKRSLLRLVGVCKDDVLIGPEAVQLQITGKCNLSCAYCFCYNYRKSENYKYFQDMDIKKIRKIIDECCELKVDLFRLSGEGEPTLHFNFCEIMDYLKDKNMKVEMHTNASFPKSIFKHVLMVRKLTINLSSTKLNNYKILQAAKINNFGEIFYRTLDNIRKIAFLRKKNPLLFPSITIIFIINKINYKDIDSMFDFAHHLGVDIVCKVLRSNKFNKNIGLSASDLRNLKIKLINYYKNFSKYKEFNFVNLLDFPLVGSFGIKNNRFFINELSKVKSCIIGWYNVFINLMGGVSLCCLFHDMGIGNIYKDSLKRIWYSRTFMEWRKLGKYNRFNNEFKQCNKCAFCKINNRISKLSLSFQVDHPLAKE